MKLLGAQQRFGGKGVLGSDNVEAIIAQPCLHIVADGLVVIDDKDTHGRKSGRHRASEYGLRMVLSPERGAERSASGITGCETIKKEAMLLRNAKNA